MHYIKDSAKRHSKLSVSYRKFSFYLYEEFYRRVEINTNSAQTSKIQIPLVRGCVSVRYMQKNVLGKFIAENISKSGSRLFYESSGILAPTYIVIVTNVFHLINRFVLRGSRLINVQRNDCNILLKSWE